MSESADGRRAPELYRVAWILYLLLAAGGLIWIGLRDGGFELSVFVNTETWWLDLGAGAAAAAVLIGGWELGRRLLPSARDLEDQLRKILAGVSTDQAIALALMSGFAEELLFRGAIQPAWGLIPATVLFALLHSGRGRAFLLWALFAGAAGLLFGWLAEWHGNLLAPIAAHVLVNAINLRRLAAEGGDSSRDDAFLDSDRSREPLD